LWKPQNHMHCLQVITQGKLPTVVAKGGSVQTFDVPSIDSSLIVDTNGAGDAFVGGFLAAHIKGHDTEKCCAAGCFAAGTIIQTSGTALPEVCSYNL
jgi:adenosine kinase